MLWLCMSSSVLFFYTSHSVLVNSYIKMNLQHIVKWNYPPTTAITGSSTQHKQACRSTHFVWNTHYRHSCPLKLEERNSFPQLLQLTLRFASEKPFPAITVTNSSWSGTKWGWSRAEMAVLLLCKTKRTVSKVHLYQILSDFEWHSFFLSNPIIYFLELFWCFSSLAVPEQFIGSGNSWLLRKSTVYQIIDL